MEFEAALVSWINTFDLPTPVVSFEELLDGLVLGKMLSKLIPTFPVNSLKEEATSNDYLKLSNLKRIVSALDTFYKEVLNIPSDAGNLNLNAIVFDKSSVEIQKLIELFLGAVVECDQKAEFIQKMLGMEKTVQSQLMLLIQAILEKHQLNRAPVETSNDDEFLMELDDKTQSIKELEQVYSRLQTDYQELQIAYNNTKKENAAYLDQIASMEQKHERLSLEVSSKGRFNETTYEELLRKMDQQKAEDSELLHQARAEVEAKNNLLTDLRKKVEELSRSERETRSLRDEVDILREKAAKVEVLEDRLKKALLKAESVIELRSTIENLESQNEVLLKQLLEAETAAKKTDIFRGQVEVYKEQLATLTAERMSLAASVQEKDNFVEQLKKQILDLREEANLRSQKIERLEIDLNYMKQEQTESLASEITQDNDRVTDLNVKMKLDRLEIENKRLKSGEGVDKVFALENELDDAKRLNEKYRRDIESMKKLLTQGTSSEESSSQLQMLELNYQSVSEDRDRLAVQNKKLAEENKKYLEELNVFLKESKTNPVAQERVADLQSKLQLAEKKIKTLTDEKNKLDAYLKTAKTMIKEERNKSSAATPADVTKLVEQLKEKDKEIAKLKNSLEEGKQGSEKEQKLMSSAIHDITLQFQRLMNRESNSSKDSVSAPVKKDSLLGQMREKNKK